MSLTGSVGPENHLQRGGDDAPTPALFPRSHPRASLPSETEKKPKKSREAATKGTPPEVPPPRAEGHGNVPLPSPHWFSSPSPPAADLLGNVISPLILWLQRFRCQGQAVTGVRWEMGFPGSKDAARPRGSVRSREVLL